jgi:predicted site-specific integrase-resolvase
MLKTKMRGPYTIDQLSTLTGISLEALRHYQQIGVIPKERAWSDRPPQEVFYKVDVDRIREQEMRQKRDIAEERVQTGPSKTDLSRKLNRLINVHARQYPEVSRRDVLEVLHRTYVKYLNQEMTTATA